MNFSEMSDIFYNNLFFKWITPDASGSERGGGQTRQLSNKTFFPPTVFKKKFVDNLNLNQVFLADDETYVESGRGVSL